MLWLQAAMEQFFLWAPLAPSPANCGQRPPLVVLGEGGGGGTLRPGTGRAVPRGWEKWGEFLLVQGEGGAWPLPY